MSIEHFPFMAPSVVPQRISPEAIERVIGGVIDDVRARNAAIRAQAQKPQGPQLPQTAKPQGIISATDFEKKRAAEADQKETERRDDRGSDMKAAARNRQRQMRRRGL